MKTLANVAFAALACSVGIGFALFQSEVRSFETRVAAPGKAEVHAVAAEFKTADVSEQGYDTRATRGSKTSPATEAYVPPRPDAIVETNLNQSRDSSTAVVHAELGSTAHDILADLGVSEVDSLDIAQFGSELSRTFEAEGRDAVWADQTEYQVRNLTSATAPSSRLDFERVECRSTVCKGQLKVGDFDTLEHLTIALGQLNLSESTILNSAALPGERVTVLSRR